MISFAVYAMSNILLMKVKGPLKNMSEFWHGRCGPNIPRIGSTETCLRFFGQLQESCDFLMKNFDARQTAREEEPKGWDCYCHPTGRFSHDSQ